MRFHLIKTFGRFQNLPKVFFISCCLWGIHVQAQDASDNTQAAENATNPLAFVTKLQFQPNYTFLDVGGDQLSLISRISQPTKTVGLPFIKSKDPSKIYTIYRLEVPVISQTLGTSNPLNATGLSDIALLDVVAFSQEWGLIGAGGGLIFPTASPDVLGTGKLNAGPVAVALYTKIPKLQVGLLAQQYFSIAGNGDRSNQSFMLFQPIVNKVLNNGYFLQFSPIMKFDWESSSYSIPISVAFGRAFAKNLSMFIAPEYVISGPGQGNFTIRLNINTMFAAM